MRTRGRLAIAVVTALVSSACGNGAANTSSTTVFEGTTSTSEVTTSSSMSSTTSAAPEAPTTTVTGGPPDHSQQSDGHPGSGETRVITAAELPTGSGDVAIAGLASSDVFRVEVASSEGTTLSYLPVEVDGISAWVIPLGEYDTITAYDADGSVLETLSSA